MFKRREERDEEMVMGNNQKVRFSVRLKIIEEIEQFPSVF
jgi:hypothetical protein